jgi:hypothetical protein
VVNTDYSRHPLYRQIVRHDAHLDICRWRAGTAAQRRSRRAIPLDSDDRLREIHFGNWEGHSAAELMATEPEALTAFARTTLRGRFLAADCGITGANFLVADSGRVVLVEKLQIRVVLLEPQDALSNRQHLEMGGDAPNLRDYWQVARKHQWKIVACFVAAIIVAAVIVFSMTPMYTAKATLLIERKDRQVVNIKQVLSDSVEADESSYYESQYQVLRSRSLAAEVIRSQGLDQDPEFTSGGAGDN